MLSVHVSVNAAPVGLCAAVSVNVEGHAKGWDIQNAETKIFVASVPPTRWIYTDCPAEIENASGAV